MANLQGLIGRNGELWSHRMKGHVPNQSRHAHLPFSQTAFKVIDPQQPIRTTKRDLAAVATDVDGPHAPERRAVIRQNLMRFRITDEPDFDFWVVRPAECDVARVRA